MTSTLKLIDQHCMFGGWQKRYQHVSKSLNSEATFGIYFPPQYETKKALPVLYWLSGLTCTDENFAIKSGAQRIAAELGLILVMPDTSPRGDNVADESSYDIGQGAGFYVNATEAPWNEHYRMYDYVVQELPNLIESQFKTSDMRSICGHSMGGHGALMVALRNPHRYFSASAFSPIVNPSKSPWGRQAFAKYLGSDEQSWLTYDSCHLLTQCNTPFPILVDQGDADNFLPEQLQPAQLVEAARSRDWPLTLRIQPGYDHSYFFIASFIEEHLRFHMKAMGL